MSYQYDVFISYKRGGLYGDWVHDVFKDLFQAHLNQCLDWDAKIFIDVDNIQTGDAWPKHLQNALADSKCLLGIWSPQYFRSTWCQYECSVMLDRGQNLIIPISLHDGKRFPECVENIQRENFNDFALSKTALKVPKKRLKLEKKTNILAKATADIIQHVPSWQNKYRENQQINHSFHPQTRSSHIGLRT